MNRLFLICCFVLAVASNIYAQIALPREFYCEPPEDRTEDGVFTNGKYRFSTTNYNRSGCESVQWVLESDDKWNGYGSDHNLYWTTSQQNGRTVFTVLTEELFEYRVSSLQLDEEFTAYSAWLLKQVREAEIGSSFTDFMGLRCEYTE